ncbi:MAG: DUF1345 domain-containing protein [Betaproteobacteria bacterium]|jgi:uncharacterized membrane protein|uniref:Transmembrane protein n=1 Tax=Thiomonas intermedia (strain K12) TaxID=75379 RepID=D5X5P1_THIK1|nr:MULTISPECIES: DUF1345 domain-containing protein [Thiomonas]MDE2268682.1 DUF1345 domain-containing protein [Betaproteobacteria bacterium]OZB73633.1 MAG: hypothetical protein B7X36_09005 [Thiomonas sp. 14-64-326]HML82037.1 DUF1345 domain-containing protein [Thiomonas arsenitoxydans]
MRNPLLTLYRTLSHRPRLSAAIALGVVLWAVLSATLPHTIALLWAFDASALLFLVSTAWMMAHATTETLKRRTELEAEGRWTVLLFSLVLSGAVFAALSVELHAVRGHPGALALAGSSIVLSWLFFSVIFALQYAHSDYTARTAGTPALMFPNSQVPDYWDYLYFSVVLSMTFQTSDVNIAGRHVRHLVLLHSVAAFFFNVVILALTVNALAGAF